MNEGLKLNTPEIRNPGTPGADQVFAEHIRHLYRLARIGYLGTLLNATLMMFALWDVADRTTLTALLRCT